MLPLPYYDSNWWGTGIADISQSNTDFNLASDTVSEVNDLSFYSWSMFYMNSFYSLFFSDDTYSLFMLVIYV
jgi:hypothetical protein